MNLTIARLRLATALGVPLEATGFHSYGKIFYESPFILESGKYRRFQVSIHSLDSRKQFEGGTFSWSNRLLEELEWHWHTGYGFWGNPDPCPYASLFGRMISAFGYETDLLTAHEKMELHLELQDVLKTYERTRTTNE